MHEVTYNGYNETYKKATVKYMKDKLKQLNVRFNKEEYENILMPLFKKSGMKPTTYIKVALKEKLNRDFPGELPENAITDAETEESANE